MTEHKIRIKLYGALRHLFGKEYTFVGRAPADAIRALCRMKPGFQQYLADHSEPGFHVLVGDKDLGEDELRMPTPKIVRLVPVVHAASGGFRIVLGAALIVVGAYATFLTAGQSAFLINMGAAMVIGGAAEMLAKPPAFAPSGLDKGPADTPTYAFQGPHITTGQGNCVPVGMGRCRIGGALISLGISPETWPVKGFGGKAPDEVGTRGGDGDLDPYVWAVAPS